MMNYANIPGFYPLPAAAAASPVVVVLWALVGLGVLAAVVLAVILVYRARAVVVPPSASVWPLDLTPAERSAVLVYESRAEALAAERSWSS